MSEEFAPTPPAQTIPLETIVAEIESDPEMKAVLDEARKMDMLEGATVTDITPAQEDKWQQAVLNECMAIEGCYKEADPAGTVKCLIDWHVANERRHAAQNDEPVAWMDVHDNWDLYKNKPSQVDVIPLYTRPDNSELRKAAEEAKRVLSGFIDEYGGDEVDAFVLEKLRAALEGR